MELLDSMDTETVLATRHEVCVSLPLYLYFPTLIRAVTITKLYNLWYKYP